MNKSYNFLIFLLVFSGFLFSCKTIQQEVDIYSLQAPAKFDVMFQTTKGDFTITTERDLSPLAVDRFYQLVKSGYFTDIPFYRGVANFVVQFGTLDTVLDAKWSENILIDEPVKKGNLKGTLSFARAGVNTRGTQLFININDNSRLDTVTYGGVNGFPVFGWVSSGMDVVMSICTEYGDTIRQRLEKSNEDLRDLLKTEYPKLDYIKTSYVIEK
ncbi:MAG: hypothetical protein A2X64_09350 [Ignavibacteria bacterium GWF2_33_9]|nr:MAG: hypothetical protein A2X64_09350 [Ignavibacteria bacterium GWF2_33_9]